MHYKVIAPIHGLEWKEDLEGLQLDVFTLTKNENIIKSYIHNHNFELLIGQINFYGITKSPCIVFDHGHAKQESGSYAHAVHDLINSALREFWFLKDCSLFTQQCFVQDIRSSMILNNVRSMISNSSGRHANTIIEKTDIEKVNLKIKERDTISLLDNLPITDNPTLEKPAVVNISTKNFLDPQNESRIERAQEFLYFARSNTKLTVKISFYVAIYECLFSTDEIEISHKIAERAAKILGNTTEERISIYDQIKEAYGIRSRYIHGSKEKNSDDKLIIISQGIDELTRNLFNNIHFKQKDIFNKSKADLDTWFKQLILN